MANALVTFPPSGWRHYQRHRDEIAELLDPRCYSIAWLDCQLVNGAAYAIGDDDAVIVFEMQTYPEGAREVHGLVAAGDLDAIVGLIAKAEEWGRALGCVFATISSREGWGRVLKARGYKPHQTKLRKELL